MNYMRLVIAAAPYHTRDTRGEATSIKMINSMALVSSSPPANDNPEQERAPALASLGVACDQAVQHLIGEL